MNSHLVFDFLKQIAKNNDREWFHANHDLYRAAKTEVENLINELTEPLEQLDADLRGFTDPKISMFRLFRDIRFSTDKTPYKNHFGVFFAKGGRKVHFPGYYIHIQPDASFLSGGLWLPEPNKLKAIRQEIVYNTETIVAILENPNFKKYFNRIDEDAMLSHIPAGYPKDFPFPVLLRTKSFTFSHPISDKEVFSENFKNKIMDCFTASYPMINFLKEAIEMC